MRLQISLLHKGIPAGQIFTTSSCSREKLFHPAESNQPRPAKKQSFRLSLFANQLPSSAKRQNRLLLITKKYYPLAGGLQQHQYPKQTDTVCLEAWCLVQLPCHIQARRSSYSRSEGWGVGGLLSCMLQHHNAHLSVSPWILNRYESRM